MKFVTSLLLLFFIATSFSGKVVHIADGDTISVMHNGKAEKIRLYGIDCPEISHKAGQAGQPFGSTAKDFTAHLCAAIDVKVETHGVDRYGRTIGTIILPDGTNVNEELLRAGLAWHYAKYDDNEAWAMLESTARKNKVGLWKDNDPQAPWDFRHGGN